MKIGVIGSAGGSAFQEVARILGPERRGDLTVITDRECGLEKICSELGIRQMRLRYDNRDQFSENAAEEFQRQGVDFLVLYFSKLVAESLFQRVPTYNVHPSLLPAFPGMRAVRNALDAGARYLGCTAHAVDASMDGGPIVVQSAIPIEPLETSESHLSKLSFLQKVYVSLVLIELLEERRVSLSLPDGALLWRGSSAYSDRCNPCLKNRKFAAGFAELQKRERIHVFDAC